MLGFWKCEAFDNQVCLVLLALIIGNRMGIRTPCDIVPIQKNRPQDITAATLPDIMDPINNPRK
jgi:hypothetical protein